MDTSIENENFKFLMYDPKNIISSILDEFNYVFNYSKTSFDTFNKGLNLLNLEHFDILLIDYTVSSKETINFINQVRSLEIELPILVSIKSTIDSFDLDLLTKSSINGLFEIDGPKEQLQLLIKSTTRSISQFNIIQSMNQKLSLANQKLENSYIEITEMLRLTVEAKDSYTKGHSERVAKYAVLLGKKLDVSSEDLEILNLGGLFHDIGKIGIPDSILLKQGKLTDVEYEQIKKHPLIGKNILEKSSLFKNILPIVLYHHEKYDGSGYPYGLQGKEIPYLARITSVADSFDAMTSKRSYRDELDLEFVKNELISQKNRQFDPDIVDAFIALLNFNYNDIKQIKNSY